jgi:hypothetical protein
VNPANVDFARNFFDALILGLKNEESKLASLALLQDTLSKLIKMGDINTALSLESFIYTDYLPSVETEEEYNLIYEAINKAYCNEQYPEKKSENSSSKNLLIIIHTPFFLAHISCLYQVMLDKYVNDSGTNRCISLICLSGTNQTFEFPWRQLGVEMIELDCNLSMADRLIQAADISNNMEDSVVLWMCTPLYLPFFSNLCAKVYWWSVKMHPTMPGVLKRIGYKREQKDRYQMFGFQWHGFSVPYRYYNQGRPSSARGDKAIRLGCFCRDELIDRSEYWSNVRRALEIDENIIFTYASKNPIHEKWLDSDLTLGRVEFLGWLKRPEEAISRCQALLDPWPLGHGIMLGEAVHAGVPIVFSWGHEARETPFRRYIASAQNRIERKDKDFLLGFKTDESFDQCIKDVVISSPRIPKAVETARRILDQPNDGWKQFEGLIWGQ